MGRVTVEALVENLEDQWAVKEAMLPAEEARRVVIPDALVDPRAKLLSLPTSVIQQLGLERAAEGGWYDPVRLTIQGRFCTMDVLEVPDGVPALIGRIPLHHLDFVIDLRERKLVGNPAHGGEHVYEV